MNISEHCNTSKDSLWEKRLILKDERDSAQCIFCSDASAE